jgi:glycosyltransferase involved in cell wall biosynthesis
MLVPPDDAEALAQAVAQLMDDRALRERWGKAARAIVVDEFSAARVGKEIVMLYARLLAEQLAPRLKTSRATSCPG